MAVAVSQVGDRDVKDDSVVIARAVFCVTHVSVKGNDTSCCCINVKQRLLIGVKNHYPLLLIELLFSPSIKNDRVSTNVSCFYIRSYY